LSLFHRLDIVHNSLDHRSSSSTEVVIQRTIEGIQRLIKNHDSSQGEEDEEEEPVTLQNLLFILFYISRRRQKETND
jgi:hypothetical protein